MEPGKPRCPRCGLPLVASHLEWVSSCGRCGGVFAARIVGPLGANVAEVARAASHAARVRAASAPRVGCPICARPATRESFRGIDVDRCAEHGIWFDRDEIQHLFEGTTPQTMQGLGPAASGAVATAAAMPARSVAGENALSVVADAIDVDDVIDLADVGLEVGAPLAEAGLEAAEHAARMFVDLVSGLFDHH